MGCSVSVEIKHTLTNSLRAPGAIHDQQPLIDVTSIALAYKKEVEALTDIFKADTQGLLWGHDGTLMYTRDEND